MNDKNIKESFGKILVVDDEETMRRSLADILRLEGYHVNAVSSGEAALEALRAANRPGVNLAQEGYDVMLLDLKMPGMDGLEVLRAASRIAPDTMYILLTAHGSLESAIDAIHYQAHDYLLKPASPQQIVNSVTKAIGRRAELLHKRALLEQRRSTVSQSQNGEVEDDSSLLLGRNSSQVYSAPKTTLSSSALTRPEIDMRPTLEPRLIALANDVVVDLARREVWRPQTPVSKMASGNMPGEEKAASGNPPGPGLHTGGTAGDKVRLTPTEGKLLKVLLENRGRVLTHRELVLMVQGYEVTDWEAPEVLRPLVSRLRQKLKRFPEGESWIVNVRGTGYVLERRQKDHGPTDGVERRQNRSF